MGNFLPVLHLKIFARKSKKAKSVTKPKNPRDTEGLLGTIELAVGARVIITKNVDTSD